VIPFGKGLYEFLFISLEYKRCVFAVGLYNIFSGFVRVLD